jgi:divalent metal cation (Fe/Co/Zn/Cd) transporter
MFAGKPSEPSSRGASSSSRSQRWEAATISLLVLPPLGIMKLRLAVPLRSRALRGDGVLTIAAAALAVVTLIALLTSSVLGWWWTDPVAALIIAIALGVEATRVAIHHRFG